MPSTSPTAKTASYDSAVKSALDRLTSQIFIFCRAEGEACIAVTS